jgi:hypothetical protein
MAVGDQIWARDAVIEDYQRAERRKVLLDQANECLDDIEHKVEPQRSELQAAAAALVEQALTKVCRVCGCTDDDACQPMGCFWLEPGLCSQCEDEE